MKVSRVQKITAFVMACIYGLDSYDINVTVETVRMHR